MSEATTAVDTIKTGIASSVRSKLAKLLAAENITVLHSSNVKTASFNVYNRTLMLPVWQNISVHLYDMLIVHEVGHALDTPTDWMPAIDRIAKTNFTDKATRQKAIPAIKGFLNVIEDARIDKRQKRRYPGSRKDYFVGYQELLDRNFFGTQDKDIKSYSLIDRLNLHFKVGSVLKVPFSSEEMKIVNRIAQLETWEEVVDATSDVFAIVKNDFMKKQETVHDDIDFSNEEDGDGYGDDYHDDAEDLGWDDDQAESDTYDDGEDDSEEEEKEDVKNSKSSKPVYAPDEPSVDVEKDKDQDSIGAGGNEVFDGGHYDSDDNGEEKTEEYIPQSQTEKAYESKLENNLTNTDVEYRRYYLPEVNYKEAVVSYKDNLAAVKSNPNSVFARNASNPQWWSLVNDGLNQFKQKENSTISFMVNEFEMRKAADISMRTSISKSGIIDTNKLHSYRYNEDIFRRFASVPKGKNHGFFMVIDWSGSMSSNLKYTIKQLLILVYFCKRVQIPFEVYLYRTSRGYERSKQGCFPRPNAEEKTYFKLEDFRLVQLFDSKMSLKDFNDTCLYLWTLANYEYCPVNGMGSTPTNEALRVMPKLINDFRDRHKIEVVNTIMLTDGDANYVTLSGHDRYGYMDNKNKIDKKYIISVAVDEETGDEYFYEEKTHIPGTTSFSVSSSNDLTDILQQALKKKTGCNLMGFYLLGKKAVQLWSFKKFYPNLESKKDLRYLELRKKFNNEGFLVTQYQAYDDFYVLNTGQELDTTLDISKAKTHAGIAKQFIKFAGKKRENRILLSRFMKKICNTKEKSLTLYD